MMADDTHDWGPVLDPWNQEIKLDKNRCRECSVVKTKMVVSKGPNIWVWGYDWPYNPNLSLEKNRWQGPVDPEYLGKTFGVIDRPMMTCSEVLMDNVLGD